MRNALGVALGFAFITGLMTVPAQGELAKTTPAPGQSKVTRGSDQLPVCIDNAADIKKVTDALAANKATEHKYKGYRKVLANEDGKVTAIRLAYAETIAASCPDLNSEMIPGITDVIANRVRVKKGDIKSVVYQKDQFASSLNDYPGSHLKDFLCPKDAKLWSEVAKSMTRSLNGRINLPNNAYNYYFYQHKFKGKPFPVVDWAKKTPIKTSNFTRIEKCVKFFNNEPFK